MPCDACKKLEDEERLVGATQTPGPGPAASFGRYVPQGDEPAGWSDWLSFSSWLSFGPGWSRWFPNTAWLAPTFHYARFWTVQARAEGGAWYSATWTPPRSRAEVCSVLSQLPPDREVVVTGWDSTLSRAIENYRGSLGQVLGALGCAGIGNPDIAPGGIGNPDISPWGYNLVQASPPGAYGAPIPVGPGRWR